jgi:hypothetical protein
LAILLGEAPVAGVVLKAATVEGVCAGLGNIVHDSAGIASVFGAKVVTHNLHFPDHIRVAEEEGGPGDRIVVVGLAINLKVVRATA